MAVLPDAITPMRCVMSVRSGRFVDLEKSWPQMIATQPNGSFDSNV